MRYLLSAIILFSLSHTNLSAKVEDQYLGVQYLNAKFGNIHRNTSKYSETMTTIACGHPLKVYANKSLLKGWRRVFVGEERGHIESRFLSEKRPSCFQTRYPKYFDMLNLDISEMYYWGRLSEQVIHGVTKAQ